jgi:hypothetical protein
MEHVGLAADLAIFYIGLFAAGRRIDAGFIPLATPRALKTGLHGCYGKGTGPKAPVTRSQAVPIVLVLSRSAIQAVASHADVAVSWIQELATKTSAEIATHVERRQQKYRFV